MAVRVATRFVIGFAILQLSVANIHTQPRAVGRLVRNQVKKQRTRVRTVARHGFSTANNANDNGRHYILLLYARFATADAIPTAQYVRFSLHLHYISFSFRQTPMEPLRG